MVVVMPTKAGDPLSIDYGNNFMRPTAERKEDLMDSHGFTCTCEACTSLHDRCRAFRCPKHQEGGVICPIGLGQKKEEWECLRWVTDMVLFVS